MEFPELVALSARLIARGVLMRPVLAVAFLSASLVFLSPACAQQPAHPSGFSGGHMGTGYSGAHFGGSMGPVGNSFAGGPFGRSAGFAPHSFTTAPRFVSPAPARAFAPAPSRAFTPAPSHAFVPGFRMPDNRPATGEHRDRWGNRDRDHDGDRDFHYRSPYRGDGFGIGVYPYLYANSWELLPGDLGYPGFTDDNSGYNSPSGYDTQSAGNQQSPAGVAPVPADGYRPDYAGPADQPYSYAPAPAAPSASSSVAPEPALLLIFNDGHQQAIHNYVLTSEAVIVLDEAAAGRQQRIPLSALNVTATEQAAQQAGLDFSPPA